ncbi:MAG: hypothetical protein HY584_06415 [Candidatus Omnitrophica bacterium]|nr:hypothetical protein [Candidatus Omnitrophota bacterium]
MVWAANSNKIGGRRRTSHHPVKMTALTYLREALLNEAYEDCPLLIEIAKEFGAEDFEVRDLLEDPRRRPN